MTLHSSNHNNLGIAFHHQKVHWLFGIGDECVSCAMATGYSPDDPIFMLLHSFTAYLRAVWASCHGYDTLSGDELDDHPEAYDPRCAEGYPDCGVIELDDVYQFSDEMINQKWSITSTMEVTPRKMWDFSDWNTRFDRGSFINRAGLETSTECDLDSLRNSKWLTPSKKEINSNLKSSNDRLQILDRVSPPDMLSKTVYDDEVGILEEIEHQHSNVLLQRLEREEQIRRHEMDLKWTKATKSSPSTNFLNEMAWEGQDVVSLLKEGEDIDIPALEPYELVDIVDVVDAEEQSEFDDVLQYENENELKSEIPVVSLDGPDEDELNQMEPPQKQPGRGALKRFVVQEPEAMDIAMKQHEAKAEQMELMNININASLQRPEPTFWQKYADTCRAFMAFFIIIYWSFRFYQFIRSRGCDVKYSLLRATERAIYGSV